MDEDDQEDGKEVTAQEAEKPAEREDSGSSKCSCLCFFGGKIKTNVKPEIEVSDESIKKASVRCTIM